MKTRAVLIILFMLAGTVLFAQQVDSLTPTDSSKALRNKKKVYSHARRATVMSALLPGLGQGYNKKYWKIPLIYAGLGGFGYMYYVNNEEYTYYRDNLRAIYDEDPSTVNTTNYQYWQLQSLRDQYKKNRDLALIGFFAVYLLNIVDANVDGHLSTFDVSDKLGLHLDPLFYPRFPALHSKQAVYGMSLTFNLK